MTPKSGLHLVSTFEEFKALKEGWNNLYNQSDRYTIFSSWDWMITWWDVFHDQNKRELFILCYYDNDQLIGIAPFQIDQVFPKALIQGKTLRFIGLGEASEDSIQSEYLDFLVSSGMEKIFTNSVSDFLVKNKKRWNFADFEFLLKDALILKCFDSLNSEVVREEVEYGVRFTIPQVDSFESYQNDLMGKRWSKMFTKRSQRLSRDGEVKIDSTESMESIKPALDSLADMHCARWQGKNDTCIFKSSRFYRFHQKILETLVPQNKASIKTLTLDGKALASYYLFEDKDQLHYYQSGFYAENANRYSPLFILICSEIGSAIGNKKMFDFMFDENPQSYKKEQYAASGEAMIRLKWTPQPFRFVAFRYLKSIKTTLVNLSCRIKNLLKK